jgi:hypothetical protein
MSPTANSGVTPVSLTRAASMPSSHCAVMTEQVELLPPVLM